MDEIRPRAPGAPKKLAGPRGGPGPGPRPAPPPCIALDAGRDGTTSAVEIDATRVPAASERDGDRWPGRAEVQLVRSRRK